MAHVIPSFTWEVTTTGGTGPVDLEGAARNYARTFASGVGNGNECEYAIVSASDFERGKGTVTTGSPDTLSRDTIRASSNGGNAVNFGTASKDVFVVFTEEYVDNVTIPRVVDKAFVDGLGVDAGTLDGNDSTAFALSGHTHSNATTSSDGFLSSSDKTKINGIEAGATADQTASEIKTAYESNADTNAFTDSEQTKLGGIESGAEVNPADTDALTEGSTNLYYTDVRVNTRIDTRVDKAFVDGLGVDADTLDGNDSSAFFTISSDVDHDQTTNYVSNEHIDHSTITVSAGTGLTGGGDLTSSRTLSVTTTIADHPGKTDNPHSVTAAQVGAASSSHVGSGGTGEHSAATQTTAGFLSSGDKVKLDGVESGATNYTDSDAQAAVGKTDVGLGNVLDQAQIGQGKHTIGLPAAAWTSADTNGAESATNAFTNLTLTLLDFDAATEESAYVVIPMPVSSDESAGLTAQVGWTDTAGNSGDVVWGLSAAAVGDDDGLGASFGTEVTVTDTRTAQNDLMQSPETGTITPSGSWAAGDLMVVKLARKAGDVSDTLGGDARMVNVRLFYTINAATDA